MQPVGRLSGVSKPMVPKTAIGKSKGNMSNRGVEQRASTTWKPLTKHTTGQLVKSLNQRQISQSTKKELKVATKALDAFNRDNKQKVEADVKRLYQEIATLENDMKAQVKLLERNTKNDISALKKSPKPVKTGGTQQKRLSELETKLKQLQTDLNPKTQNPTTEAGRDLRQLRDKRDREGGKFSLPKTKKRKRYKTNDDAVQNAKKPIQKEIQSLKTQIKQLQTEIKQQSKQAKRQSIETKKQEITGLEQLRDKAILELETNFKQRIATKRTAIEQVKSEGAERTKAAQQLFKQGLTTLVGLESKREANKGALEKATTHIKQDYDQRKVTTEKTHKQIIKQLEVAQKKALQKLEQKKNPPATKLETKALKKAHKQALLDAKNVHKLELAILGLSRESALQIAQKQHHSPTTDSPLASLDQLAGEEKISKLQSQIASSLSKLSQGIDQTAAEIRDSVFAGADKYRQAVMASIDNPKATSPPLSMPIESIMAKATATIAGYEQSKVDVILAQGEREAQALDKNARKQQKTFKKAERAQQKTALQKAKKAKKIVDTLLPIIKALDRFGDQCKQAKAKVKFFFSSFIPNIKTRYQHYQTACNRLKQNVNAKKLDPEVAKRGVDEAWKAFKQGVSNDYQQVKNLEIDLSLKVL